MGALSRRGILLILIYCDLSSKVLADGVFQLKLLRFVNDEGLDQTGRCCTNSSSTVCSKPCRTAFRICLTHFQSNVDLSPQCTFGDIATPVLGENTFNPVSTQYIQDNPIQFNFTFRWPVSFSLVVDVYHETDQENVVISRLVKSTEALPVKPGERSWTRPEPYVHRKSVLFYEYRVVCGKDVYGEGCSTFCRPRNDKLGHYTCDANGEKICLHGWSKSENDPYCTRALCVGGCDPHKGTCTAPGKCECYAGWSGKDCSQCLTLPNCVHGTCTKPYQCDCLSGWGGSYCNQDLNYCTNNQPCRNGATCSNTGEGSYTCSCPPGFIGINCQVEVNECDPDPCQNGAQCVDMKNEYNCVCPAHFYGRNCDETNVTCSNRPCLNGGTCRDGVEQYVCKCPSGWSGINCEKAGNRCVENPCQNNGSCEETSDGFQCDCKTGFIGDRCEIFQSKCADMMCLNGGSCLDHHSCQCQRCKCLVEYTGNRCERDSGVRSTGKVPGFDGEGAVVISKKTTYRSEHYEENHTETRIVHTNDKPSVLSTSQWLGICLGAAALVLLLIISASCLVYHKRKVSKRNLQQRYQPPSVELQSTRSLDLSIVTDHSSQEVAITREKPIQNPPPPIPRLSTSSFQQKTGSATDVGGNYDRRNRSQSRSSGKSLNVVNDGRRYSNYICRSKQHLSGDFEESLPLRPLSYHSASINPSPGHVSSVKMRDRVSDRPRSLRHSMSKPPTYEEACLEKDVVARNGLQRSNGIAV